MAWVTPIAALVADTTTFFNVQCSESSCPGSFYNMITTAWANIAYVTHSDFIRLVTETEFGAWAPLLYAVAAIGGLISVALNNPPRNYAWFFMGPPIFYFLITPLDNASIYGVSWRVAGEEMDMEEVWKNAEVGIVNTSWAQEGSRAQEYSKMIGHGAYNLEVGQGLVFLDQLFSTTTNVLVAFVGIGNQRGTGKTDSNLAEVSGGADGPWHLMANAKWGLLQNIVGAKAKDPDVRDALVTFLASECGEGLKEGIDDGRYMAAMSSRGHSLPKSVLKKGEPGVFDRDGLSFSPVGELGKLLKHKGTIPAPRSVKRLVLSGTGQGSFGTFAKKMEKFKDRSFATEIPCRAYLYTVIQALRWESGHAYWQMLRAAPRGFNIDQMIQTLFYGWDIRALEGQPVADSAGMQKFVKQLIFLYMLKNELQFAPELTETTQRFAPSEQARNFTEAYVREQGSTAKAGELYNWAVLMPHVQGILAYLIIIGYPFAAMMMVIPGQWKAFYTWMTFFAWIKLWDVGFAIVHTLERSVWAMIGNGSAMSQAGSMLLQTADHVGEIQVSCSGGAGSGDVKELCPVPNVTEASELDADMAWALLDKTFAAMGAADLDLANGYYIYIMAALYFAVPAVTGQLVLGAKAGMASLATQAIGQNAQEAGGAAKSGAVGEANQRIGQVGQAIGQAATAKSYRKSGLAAQMFDTQNQALDAGLEGERIKNTQGALGARAGAVESLGKSYGSARGVVDSAVGLGSAMAGGSNSGSGTGSGTGGLGMEFLKYGGRVGTRMGALGMDYKANELTQAGLESSIGASAAGVDAAWLGSQQAQRGQGLTQYGQRLGSAADFEAQSAAWEAKNAWGSQVSGIAGVYGANPGSLVGQKPTDMTGLAMSGNLGGGNRRRASYSGFGFQSNVNAVTGAGLSRNGSSSVLSAWGGGYADPQEGPQTVFKQGMGKIGEAAGTVTSLAGNWDKLDGNDHSYRDDFDKIEGALNKTPAPVPPVEDKP